MSREMDALVAEKVMEWTHIRLFDDEEGEEYWRVPTDPLGEHNLPLFSTDIAAAWLVVEKMISKDNDMSVQIDARTGNIYVCWIGTTITKWASADTAPMAICKAALKAVE